MKKCEITIMDDGSTVTLTSRGDMPNHEMVGCFLVSIISRMVQEEIKRQSALTGTSILTGKRPRRSSKAGVVRKRVTPAN